MPPQTDILELLGLLISKLEDFAIVLTDPETRLISWHPGVRRIFGYTSDQFTGQRLDVLLTPADRQMGVGAREIQAAKDVGVANDTRWLMRRDGTLVMVDGVTIALRDPNGILVGFGKILHDVTEQKVTQDRLKTTTDALDQSNVIVRFWDGPIQHWSAGTERLYGWTAEEVMGHNDRELLRTSLPLAEEEIRRQLLATGTWRGELEQRRRDGQRLIIAANWVLVRDQRGMPSQIIETLTDVTERSEMRRELQNANAELRRMAAELERSNQELSDFARIASHDLRAPITSAGWLVDLLGSRHAQQLDDRGRECLAQIRKSLDRMSDLMEGILAHARAGLGSIRTSANSDAAAALSAALENLRSEIEGSGATIAHDAMPPVPVDNRAMTQLFQNLLSNAIKYRKRDTSPAIRISVSSQNGMWLFAVKDNGMGIDPSWAERIFLPMQRSHNADVAGSGIGLATCRKIVERAGGQIWVESRPGAGATFFFTLPKGPDPQS